MAEVVGGEDVGTRRSGVEEIGVGVSGVGAAHASEISVRAENDACVGEIGSGDKFEPCDGIEQAALE